MKPIYEEDSRAADSVNQTRAASNGTSIDSVPQPDRPRWGQRVVVFFFLVAVVIAGFGSSMGWLDHLFDSGDAHLEGVGEAALADASAAELEPSAASGAEAVTPSGSPPASSDASPPVGEFSPPPLDPIMPRDSAAILAEGRRVIEHMVREMPGAVEAKEILARFEYNFGDLQTAERLWSEILETNPNFVYAMRGLGDVATEQGRLQDAVKYFRMAVLADPPNLGRQVTLGVALMTAGQLDEARQVLESVVNKKEDYVEARVELASVLLQQEEWEAARKHLERALELAPRQPEIHFGLVKVYSHLGDRAKALEHMKLHKEYQGQFTAMREEGRRTYDDAAAMLIDVARLYVDMARVYMARGATKPAEMLLIRAARMDPENVDARQALAWMAVSQQRFFDAVRWMTEIARLQPDEFSYVQEIARLLVQAGQPDRAESELLRFHQEHPDDPGVLRTLTEFYLTVSGDFPRAIEFATKLTEVQPSGVGFALLATAHQQAGELEQAVAAFDQASELEPDNVAYRQVAALLREEIAAAAANGATPPSETPSDQPEPASASSDRENSEHATDGDR